MPYQEAASPPVASAIRGMLSTLLSRILHPAVIGPVVDVIMWILIAAVIYLVIQLAMLYATWIERKFVGRIQDRLGANRVGKFGLLQPFADMVKMLIKEDTSPAAAHRWVYNLAPILVVPPAIVVFAVIPVGIGLIATDLSVGLLFFTAVASTSVIPIFMAGWGSRNKYALLGAVRAVAQIVSYEIPQVLSVVGVLLLAGTLSTQGIVAAQGPLAVTGYAAFPGVWFILLQPIAFVIYVLAAAAEVERSPFDLPEAESELIAGYHVEYGGIKFGMFYLGIYFMTLAVSALATVLFLGGWQPPLAQLAFVPGFVWFGLKTLGMVLVFMWLRGTLPRLRMDQVMAFCWKLLVPLSLANLVAAALVGKLTFDRVATPALVFFGFALANVLLLALTAWLVLRWHRQRATGGARFEAAPATESAA
jgi:NADH-quinone oxidoreductase subunit H